MPLTNSQHDAIMRIYDSIRTNNQHLQNERYKEVTAACPEIITIENEMISLSMHAATSMIGYAAKDTASKNPSSTTPIPYLSDSSDSASSYRQQLDILNTRRARCLASLGKPADYLDDLYTCTLCKDTGYLDQHKCSCFQKKAIDLVYRDSNLKNITSSENFSTFTYDWYDNTTPNSANGLTPYNNMQQIVSICHSFIDNFDKEFSNLLLYGDTGVGKTFLTNCIARDLLDSSHSVIYLTAIELFQKFEQRDFNKHDASSSAYDSNYILDCDLLIIDDLGTEVANAYTSSRLFYCINERILRQKSVVISTNLSLSEIRDTYSERIFSRLTSSYKILKLFGHDIRILKRTGKKLLKAPSNSSNSNKNPMKM
jgi:DNA replication protein DnaC